jgi:translation initiation factor 2 gamma subunit (eIF-2gamma)
MPVIMGTAGHIDHGKTTLIKALTGIDCDRLVEEKKRGITIELGSPSWTCPGTGGWASSTCPATSASSKTWSPARPASTS